MVYELPLQGVNELFETEINGSTYTMRVRWNHKLQQWTLDLARNAKDWIIRNLALVAGQNLLQQYDHFALGFELWISVDGDPNADATFNNLGSKARLLVIIDD